MRSGYIKLVLDDSQTISIITIVKVINVIKVINIIKVINVIKVIIVTNVIDKGMYSV